MSFMLTVLAAVSASAAAPLVPGACTEPAAAHVDEAGCYLAAELTITAPPTELYWHIAQFTDRQAAEGEATQHRWARVVVAHGRTWLLVLGSHAEHVTAGTNKKVIGPLRVPPGSTASVRFLTSNFPPGMQTRVHAHPGPEAFYVVDGEQCVETPTARRRIPAGGSYIVPGGLHMQAAAIGRRSLVALVLTPGATWSVPSTEWTPSAFCAH